MWVGRSVGWWVGVGGAGKVVRLTDEFGNDTIPIRSYLRCILCKDLTVSFSLYLDDETGQIS